MTGLSSDQDAPFDADAFLAQPLVARVATAGPSIRPVWYLWESHAFWWLTGPWATFADRIAADPRVALVVDTCDLTTGQVRQLAASGAAELVPFDADRARRKLRRYLGPDEAAWERPRFDVDAMARDGVRFVRLAPDSVRLRDLSYTTAPPLS